MTRHVDVYLSVISPWAYLGHAPFLRVAETHGVTIGWKPVPLSALFSETGGLPLAKRAIQRRHYRNLELQRWAEKRGRPVKLQPAHWPFDPRLVDGAVLALIAGDQDPAAFLQAAMRGVWEEERDLASAETIAALLTEAGFDAEAVLAAAETPGTGETYEANRVAAQETGVFGAPSYVLDGEVFWGQDRIDMLDEALASGRAPYRA